MFYVLLADDGSVARYPFTRADLRLINPNTSFPEQISDDIAASFNCFPVTPTTPPVDDYTVNLERTAIKQGKDWVEKWISTPATSEQIVERIAAKANEVRAERNARLAACDWTQLPDAPVDRLSWASYRQDLRDVTSQPGFPWDVKWPLQPV